MDQKLPSHKIKYETDNNYYPGKLVVIMNEFFNNQKKIENFERYKEEEKEKINKEKKQLINEQKEIGELRIKYHINCQISSKKDKEDQEAIKLQCVRKPKKKTE